MGVIRQAITDWFNGTQNQFSTDTTLDEAINYFNRIEDRTRVRERIIDLYGRSIKKEPDPARKNAELETYTRQSFKTKVNSGMEESISIGFGSKVINALATLFTERGQKFTLTTETGEKEQQNPEKAEALLEKHRHLGGFKTAIVRADKLSIQAGSAAVLMSYANSGMTYQHIGPNSVRVLFQTTVMEDGDLRAADERDIEDASCVIIRLSSVSINEWNYLAIFGRSATYPKGRYVQYTTGNTLTVPDVGAKGTIDYYLEMEGVERVLCNPLSWWADENPDDDIPEYPIAIIYSGLTDSNTTFPTSTSLYNNCLELSCAASHTLSKSQEAATGTQVIEQNETAVGKPLPRTTVGPVALLPGQSYGYHAHNSTASMDAYEILTKIMVDIAASYSVPDYMISSEDHTIETSSGIALQVKTRPYIKFREFRADENDLSVLKIYEVEKALISLFDKDAEQPDVEELQATSQDWTPGDIVMPENKLEAAQRITLAKADGLQDEIGGLREYHQLPSDDDAIDLYEKMKTRMTKYKPLKEPAKPTIGLPGRARNQAPQSEDG